MKKIFLIAAVLCLVLAGCATNPDKAKVFDPSVPEEESCFLIVPNFVNVRMFDTTQVSWHDSILGITPLQTMVRIPAGSHILVLDYTDMSEKVYPNLILEYDFKAGSKYQIISIPGGTVQIAEQ